MRKKLTPCVIFIQAHVLAWLTKCAAEPHLIFMAIVMDYQNIMGSVWYLLSSQINAVNNTYLIMCQQIKYLI